MSIKIGIATSDGKNIDLHFGKAESLWIYELTEKGFVKTEERKVIQEEGEKSGQKLPETKTCCGSGGGCSCGGNGSRKVEQFLDLRAVIALQFGPGIKKQFENKAVSVFDIGGSVEESLKKLEVYFNRGKRS